MRPFRSPLIIVKESHVNLQRKHMQWYKCEWYNSYKKTGLSSENDDNPINELTPPFYASCSLNLQYAVACENIEPSYMT